MCDFSLQHAKSRPAQVADKLETKDFGRGTVGFVDSTEDYATFNDMTAVCVLPGTEIAFDEVPKLRYIWQTITKQPTDKVARFRQIHKDIAHTHHDALEFPDGQIVLLTLLADNLKATVLQLPAVPKTEAEAKDQERLPVLA